MKKQGRKSGRKPQPTQTAAPPKKKPLMTRRAMLTTLRTLAVAVPLAGGAGYLLVGSVQAKLAEGDLSRVGQGLPTIVQVHDPDCGLCRTLRNQTRRALASYDAERFAFLVANRRTQAGGAFAARYVVPNVTLLLFAPDGDLEDVVRGPLSQDALEGVLARHMARHG